MNQGVKGHRKSQATDPSEDSYTVGKSRTVQRPKGSRDVKAGNQVLGGAAEETKDSWRSKRNQGGAGGGRSWELWYAGTHR